MKLHLPVPLARLLCLALVCQTHAANITWNIKSDQTHIISEDNPLVLPTDGDVYKRGDGVLTITLTEDGTQAPTKEEADASSASDFAGDVYIKEGILRLGSYYAAGVHNNYYVSADVLGRTGTIYVDKGAELSLGISQNNVVEFYKSISLNGGTLKLEDAYNCFHNGITLTADSYLISDWDDKVASIYGLYAEGYRLTIDTTWGSNTEFLGEVCAENITITRYGHVSFDAGKGLTSVSVGSLIAGDNCQVEFRVPQASSFNLREISIGKDSCLRMLEGTYGLNSFSLNGDAEIRAGGGGSLSISTLSAAGYTLTLKEDEDVGGPFNVVLRGSSSAAALVLTGNINTRLESATSAASHKFGDIQINDGATLTFAGSACTPGGALSTCNALGVLEATVGNAGTSYKAVSLSSKSISGNGTGAYISDAALELYGNFSISNTTLSDFSLAEHQGADLSLTDVSLTGSNSLTITHADNTGVAGGYTLLGTDTLSGGTLIGSLSIGIAEQLLGSYAGAAHVLIALDGLNATGLTVADFSVSDAVAQKIGIVDSVSTTADGVLLYLAAGKNLTWMGGSGAWNMTNARWNVQGGQTGSTYSNGAYVTFASGNSSSTVTLDEAVEARRVTVQGSAYRFMGGSSLSIEKELLLQSVDGVAAEVSFDTAPRFGAESGIILADERCSLSLGVGNVSVMSLSNKGSVKLTKGNLSVSGSVEQGGNVTLLVGTLSLADSSANSFTKLVSSGGVVYAGAAGSLSVGGGSQLGGISGGALDVAGGSVSITGAQQTSLSSLSGSGSLIVQGSLTLAEASTLSGDLSIGETLTVESGLSLGGNLAAEDICLGMLGTTPVLEAAALIGESVNFTLSSAASAYLQSLSLTGGQSCTLASLTNGAGSTALRIDGGDAILLGKTHYTIREDAASHDIVLTAETYNACSWTSTDGVADSAEDWGGTLAGENDTVGLLGEGTSEVGLSGTVSVGVFDVEHTRAEAYRLQGDSLYANEMNVRRGALELENADTVIGGSVIVQVRGSLTVASGSRLEAANMLVEGEHDFTNAGTTILSGVLNAANAQIENTGSLTVGSGQSAIGALLASELQGAGDFAVTKGGEVTITGNSVVGCLNNEGVISMAESDLTLNRSTLHGGQLVVKDLTLATGDNAFDKLVVANVAGNTSSLELGDGSAISGKLSGGGALYVTGKVSIQELESPQAEVSIERNGYLTLHSSTVFGGSYTSAGTLLATDATLNFSTRVAQGGDVSAHELVLGSSGNSFGLLTTSVLTFVKPTVGEAMLSVQSLSAAAPEGIAVNIIDSDMQVGNYLLVDASRALTQKDFTLNADFVAECLESDIEASLGCGQDGGLYLYMVMRDENKYAHHAASANGRAAGSLIDNIRNVQRPAADTDLGKLMDSLENAINAGATAEQVDAIAAAAGGVSIPALSVALAGDVARQLRAIRNRTTAMGVDSRYEHPDMPYINAWINAEGDYRTLEDDGTASGFTLSSWGGTVGMDIDVAEELTLGFACTALYGDFSAEGVDNAEGDFDTYYASIFARIPVRGWVHTFVMTAGMADVSLERTVRHAGGSYMAEGSTDGLALGALYEVAYTISLAEDDSACWQPVANISVVHATIDAYEEEGTDAALSAGEQEFTQVSIGLGARLQTVVGESVYNRTSLLELRAMLKADIGDREGETDIAFASLPGQTASLSSNDYGAVGVELGAGLRIPVSVDAGELFFDVSAELRSGHSEVNGAAGWRVNF